MKVSQILLVYFIQFVLVFILMFLFVEENIFKSLLFSGAFIAVLGAVKYIKYRLVKKR
ncbi:MAG: hypothetical protein K0R00_837 [Herbinix sp.]|jgi:hypothetical protein|nr:hypothetical protein [Herbinix sp.]